MTAFKARPALGVLVFFAISLTLAAYFIFAAVQGDYGLFRRAEIVVEGDRLALELAALNAEVVRLENLTKRLSDGFLDLDLLDQQARDVLGLIRSDELVLKP
ncbi:septum formation initiator family protein [Cognatishimia sp. F0-27]|uniref:septum formation initiator family protein n=1 Tax=Cognatishimia sp. F0-27 TaxID=2816855 RepID=UPI001D0C3BB8|nr:septum formation initiator family protein [Cognatishimia sp. F0-27]MCC1493405.1 septum formation initiator family protein [Cognatishimia sp. F0-27]